MNPPHSPLCDCGSDPAYYWAAGGYAARCIEKGLRALELIHALCSNPYCNYVRCVITQGPASHHFNAAGENMHWCPVCKGRPPRGALCARCEGRGYVWRLAVPEIANFEERK